MNRKGEEEFEYDSSSAPSTPTNSELNGEKRKKKSRGLKKLFSSKKSADKSPGSPERGLAKEEGSASNSRRMHLPGFLKIGGRSSNNHESKSSESQSYNEETSQTVEVKKEVHVNHSQDEASKEETKLSKVDTPGGKVGEKTTLLERVKEDIHKHLHKSPKQPTVDDNGKSKEHQGPEGTKNLEQGNEVVKHDPQHHHEQKEHSNDDVKEEKLATTEPEAVLKERQDLESPSSVPLQEKESVGCESLAQGFQNVCLPWTVKKEDH